MEYSPGPADTWEYHPPGKGSGGCRAPYSAVEVVAAGLSHPGKVRPNNEDHFLVVRIGRYLKTLLTNLSQGAVPEEFDESSCAMVVADGLGGMAAGEVASELAIARLVDLVVQTPDWIFGQGEPEVRRIVDRAASRVSEVNANVAEEARQNPGLAGMATTLSLAWNVGTTLFVVHVGDSRVYLSRGSKLHKLTREHTIAEELVGRGAYPDAQSVPARQRHMLTRVIGAGSGDCDPDIQTIQLEDRDRLLLCTDGLTDMVDDAAIADQLQTCSTASEACRSLLDEALERGGKDNVTMLVADYVIRRP
jgi:protein phosphatase